ncbi:MAG: hypothetical protein JXA30_22800 [Deltaproteobacteria bacterium]|nr:hypothetical protein [Deltaproteobacteria bacterium]
MEQITPCRSTVSDRFPVASFSVRIPKDRFYEVCCTTDPRLFHPRYQGHRTADNFYSSAERGLFDSTRAENTWLLPSDQLRRFAGARRIYYALATYGNRSRQYPRFSISPDALDRIPSIALAKDFTGRTLDQRRVGHLPKSQSYGAVTGRLSWGGDAVLLAESVQNQPSQAYSGYNDGYDPSLWKKGNTPADQAKPPQTPRANPTTAPPTRLFSPSYGSPNPAHHMVQNLQPPPSRAAIALPVQRDAVAGAPRVTPARYGGHRETELHQPRPPATPRTPMPWPKDNGSEKGNARAISIADQVQILRKIRKTYGCNDVYSAVDDPITDKNRYGGTQNDGLRWGLVPFTQRSGHIGQVLSAAVRREQVLKESGQLVREHELNSVFGGALSRLLDVTNSIDEVQRLIPVAGIHLWEKPWTDRFRTAGALPYVQAAQNEVAVQKFVTPNLRLAHWLGLNDERSLAFLVDRAMQMGNGGGRWWIMRHFCPIRSQAQRRLALDALGYNSIRDFQAASDGELDIDGAFGPLTHAALCYRLRRLAPGLSPIRIPGRDEILARLISAANEAGYGSRIQSVYGNTSVFSDRPTFQLCAANA